MRSVTTALYQPPAAGPQFQCPVCGEEGLTEPDLCRHVLDTHSEDASQPIVRILSISPHSYLFVSLSSLSLSTFALPLIIEVLANRCVPCVQARVVAMHTAPTCTSTFARATSIRFIACVSAQRHRRITKEEGGGTDWLVRSTLATTSCSKSACHCRIRPLHGSRARLWRCAVRPAFDLIVTGSSPPRQTTRTCMRLAAVCASLRRSRGRGSGAVTATATCAQTARRRYGAGCRPPL
jgi:hypothetical protein